MSKKTKKNKKTNKKIDNKSVNKDDFTINFEDLEVDKEAFEKVMLKNVFDFKDSEINITKKYKDYLKEIDEELLNDVYNLYILLTDNSSFDEKNKKIEKLTKEKMSSDKIRDEISNNYELFIDRIISNLDLIKYNSLNYLINQVDENGYYKINLDNSAVNYAIAVNLLSNTLLMFANFEDDYIEIHIPKEILEVIKNKFNKEKVIKKNTKLLNTIVSLIHIYGLFKVEDIKQLTKRFDDYSIDEIKEKIMIFSVLCPLYKLRTIEDNNKKIYVILSLDIDCERDIEFINDVLFSDLEYEEYTDKQLDKYFKSDYYKEFEMYKHIYNEMKEELGEKYTNYIMDFILPTFIPYSFISDELAYEFLEEEGFEEMYEVFESITFECPNWRMKGMRLVTN